MESLLKTFLFRMQVNGMFQTLVYFLQLLRITIATFINTLEYTPDFTVDFSLYIFLNHSFVVVISAYL